MLYNCECPEIDERAISSNELYFCSGCPLSYQVNVVVVAVVYVVDDVIVVVVVVLYLMPEVSMEELQVVLNLMSQQQPEAAKLTTTFDLNVDSATSSFSNPPQHPGLTQIQ